MKYTVRYLDGDKHTRRVVAKDVSFGDYWLKAYLENSSLTLPRERVLSVKQEP